MKFGVVVFPGSNCDKDLIWAVERATGAPAVELWHKDTDLKGCDFIFIPGGFSYGDYLRSGAIAKLSPIMGAIKEFAAKGGYVMGICNGFQILCESGLLPGALLRNNSMQFICENVYLKPANDSLLTRELDSSKALKIPIAHGEGRYYINDEGLAALKANDQILFRYCDENGAITESANPNGSLENIAGVCNEGKNVFGMMPHPERAADAILFNEDGMKIIRSILTAQVNA
ncbi:MAG: phosphoribosylformylglycinamidine synthase I [Bacteroidota bacterium]|nr:phosphoribosylformylglycinamidine synthase I [Bacteroidota bacterium]MDX5431308.1 phosphoribosylformylglycinamidine synthase I [Bacteroidota bacterium]MDX5470046.1 phosphoribosylformylglycinamidine synthase I [Bacteroidota bacterium]